MNRFRLAGRIIGRFILVQRLLRAQPLPAVVDTLALRPPLANPKDVRRLRYGVDRLLDRRGRPFRCLPRALVLYSLLVDQGENPRLLIGLPMESAGTEAHAWVEVAGRDVGPNPGRGSHEPMASYPL